MVTSSRSVTIGFAGDVEYQQTFTVPNSSLGSGQNQVVAIGSAEEAIFVPVNAVAITIIPPEDNTYPLLLKLNSGDPGFPLSASQVSSIAIDYIQVDTIWMNFLGITGEANVRLIFS